MQARGGEEPEFAEFELIVAHYSWLLVYNITRDLVLVGKILKIPRT